MRVALRRPKTKAWLHTAGMTLIAATVVGIPFWIIIVNSFKPYPETVVPNLRLPDVWQPLDNYRTVLSEASVTTGFRNTAIILFSAIPIILIVAAAAAWIFARTRSRTLRALYYVMLLGVVVPPAIVASIFTLKALGLYGGLKGLSLMYSAWYIPLGIFLITGFVRGIPVELEEAARIDGASNIVIFSKIILPLLTPVLITTGLIVSISIWNDFLNPFMMLNNPDRNTLMLSLYDFATGSNVGATYSWNLVFADIVLTSLPMVAAYYYSQRFIVHGLSGVGK
ncbi:MAG: hypothetical protein CL462_12330 [Acidimicrobiaceae bacterium]|nr:hypothetical protein [Acidimicrobiaceae bacterium]|tara:strand:+ start:342 stop:1187 length:846 start_codon:yes stop_codon:yes gene_type:complete